MGKHEQPTRRAQVLPEETLLEHTARPGGFRDETHRGLGQSALERDVELIDKAFEKDK